MLRAAIAVMHNASARDVRFAASCRRYIVDEGGRTGRNGQTCLVIYLKIVWHQSGTRSTVFSHLKGNLNGWPQT